MYFLLIKVFNTELGQRKLFYLALGWGKDLIHISLYLHANVFQ